MVRYRVCRAPVDQACGEGDRDDDDHDLAAWRKTNPDDGRVPPAIPDGRGRKAPAKKFRDEGDDDQHRNENRNPQNGGQVRLQPDPGKKEWPQYFGGLLAVDLLADAWIDVDAKLPRDRKEDDDLGQQAVMHQHVTYNRYYPTQKQFANAIRKFFRETLPKEWKTFQTQVSDNFRVVTYDKFQVLA